MKFFLPNQIKMKFRIIYLIFILSFCYVMDNNFNYFIQKKLKIAKHFQKQITSCKATHTRTLLKN